MSTYRGILADYADAQFDGESLDGPSFMRTLEKLDWEAASSTATHEGYSAWEVALHVFFYKYFLLEKLGGAADVEPYPYPKANFAEPSHADAVEWSLLHKRLRDVHRALMARIRALPEARLTEPIPEWNFDLGRAIAWLCGHDGYHAAQIRNMGVPGLRIPKES